MHSHSQFRPIPVIIEQWATNKQMKFNKKLKTTHEHTRYNMKNDRMKEKEERIFKLIKRACIFMVNAFCVTSFHNHMINIEILSSEFIPTILSLLLHLSSYFWLNGNISHLFPKHYIYLCMDRSKDTRTTKKTIHTLAWCKWEEEKKPPSITFRSICHQVDGLIYTNKQIRVDYIHIKARSWPTNTNPKKHT